MVFLGVTKIRVIFFSVSDLSILTNSKQCCDSESFLTGSKTGFL